MAKVWRWSMVFVCALAIGLGFEACAIADEEIEVTGNVEVFLAADGTTIEQISVVNDEGIELVVVLDEKGLELKAMDGKRVMVKGVMTQENTLKVLEFREVSVAVTEEPA